MKQETLEEAAEKIFYNIKNKYRVIPENTSWTQGFLEGYKLAQEQNKNLYSEEEVYNIVQKAIEENRSKQLHFFDIGYSNPNYYNPNYYNLKEWFEQFKKKIL